MKTIRNHQKPTEFNRPPPPLAKLLYDNDNNSPPPLATLFHGMPYLDAVLKEVMRHHPPANILIRGIDTSPLILESTADQIGFDGKSYCLPKDARVMIDIIGLHKDPRYWNNPTVFDPNRFLPGPNQEQVESGAYIPFGGGPRTCIGNIFGLLEGKFTFNLRSLRTNYVDVIWIYSDTIQCF